MRRIYKYQLAVRNLQHIAMPEGAKILKIATQDEVPCIWALVDPDAPPRERLFHTAGTGHPLGDDSDERDYIDSYQLESGALVFHVFE